MKELIKGHWDKSAEGYSKYVMFSMRSKRREVWREILSKELGKGGLKVLDVGTGPGIIALILADLGHQVTAVDLSDGMLRVARENASKLGLSVKFEQGDAESLRFKDGSFDAVVSRALLWTLPNPKKAVKEWKRVLVPDGKIAIMDGSWHSMRKRSMKTRIWRSVSVPLIVVTERRASALSHYNQDVLSQLPLLSAERPDYDLELLKSLGFKGVHARIMKRRDEGFLEYLKYGCWGDNFLVSGLKP